MPDGDSHLAFAQAAARDGIVLSTTKTFDWLSELGHIGLEDSAAEPPPNTDPQALGAAIDALEQIYTELGGDMEVLLACRANMFLFVDLVHEPSGTLIEIDETQHFTSFRLAALDAYPPAAKLGFDPAAYRELCASWSKKSDSFGRAQAAKGFGIGGIQRERAYRDALRDLATPAMGHPPLVRIAALENDGSAAYQGARESLLDGLGAAR